MNLSPNNKMLLGAVLMAFGIAILADYSLLKAVIYYAAVLLSALLFL